MSNFDNPIDLIKEIEKIDNNDKFSKYISDITLIDKTSPCNWGKPQYKSIESMFKFLCLLDNYFETHEEIFKLLKFKITGITSKAKEKGLLTKILKNYKEHVTTDIVDDLKENKPSSIKELINYMIENNEDIWDICKYTFDIIYPKSNFENIYLSNEEFFNSSDICNIGSPKNCNSDNDSDNDSDNHSDNDSENDSENDSDNKSKSNKSKSNKSDNDESDNNESDDDESNNDESDDDEFSIKTENFKTGIKLFILIKNKNISNLDETDFMF